MTERRANRILAGLLNTSGPGSLPDRLCLTAVERVPVSGASLSLLRGTEPAGTVSASDRAVRLLEELQFSLREGPCVDAATWRRPVLEPDLRSVSLGRWPALLPALADSPIRAVFAFPLQVGQIRVGVMDLYRDSPGMLTAAQLTTALACADAATTVLLQLPGEGEAEATVDPAVERVGAHPPAGPGPAQEDGLSGWSDRLLDPVRHRAQVHQATGMVMAQAGVSLEEAFQLLVARGFAEDRPLLELSGDVVARRVRFDPVHDPRPDPRAVGGDQDAGGDDERR